MKTMRHYLYGNGGSKNHGCEAITRSTCSIFSKISFFLVSNSSKEDVSYGVNTVCHILNPLEDQTSRISGRFVMAYLALKLKNDFDPLDKLPYMDLLAQTKRGDVALSAGGDNYCYGEKGALFYRKCRKFLQRRGVKTVLWGCSVEPDVIKGKIGDDLSRYNLIVARESISCAALKAVNPNTILAPDPAFMLERQPGNFPKGLGARPCIGVNISPLIQNRENGENITLENYRNLVRYILSETDRDIALIPHVVWDYNDDRIPLGQLYEEFKHTGRVFMVEDQNCMQLKDIISGCEFFVGARTHATIAAYSTCVPTLVVGYSVKARGIARDLFGSEEGYVLPVQELKDKNDLIQAFKTLYDRKEEIRKHLADIMPDYICGIAAAKEAVDAL